MQHAANVTSGDILDWHSVDWTCVHRTVKNLRQRIFRASRAGDLKKVRSLQRLMLKSRANVLDSVRRVTQVNRGKSTPGVDHVVITTAGEKGRLCQQFTSRSIRFTRSVGSLSPNAKADDRWAFPPSWIDVGKPW
jgi:RNA-directed DNA polymerase